MTSIEFVAKLSEENARLRQSLRIIAALGGPLPDEALMTRNPISGLYAGDPSLRGLLYVAARDQALRALGLTLNELFPAKERSA